MSKTRLTKEHRKQSRNVASESKFGPTASGKPRQPKGRPAGKRNQAVADEQRSQSKGQRDPRLGSKKPIPLRPAKDAASKPTSSFPSPKEELAHIEADARLNALLDKQEANQPLTAEEGDYLNRQLERHALLCELLGINEDEEQADNKETDAEDDLLDKLDSKHLDDFQR